MVLVVGKHVQASTAKELQEFAKAHPGRMTFGSTGSGSSVHLAGELFKMRAGIDVLHVPYRGGAPAVTALLAGEIDMLLVDIPVVVSHIQSGAFKALGSCKRGAESNLPDVPTVNEAGIAGVISEGGMRCTLRRRPLLGSSMHCSVRSRTSWLSHPLSKP
jgi:Uncharacterized protein conserved in bacteria